MRLPVAAVTEIVELTETTHVALARRRALHHASLAGLDETRAGDAALIATELATNILKHAERGAISLAVIETDGHRGVAVGAQDKGPGMNVDRCLVDGMSSSGTLGQGLGAITRRASRWDALGEPGVGTIVSTEVWPKKPPVSAFDVGAVSTLYPGESVSGDGADAYEEANVAALMVVDGLGHGLLASSAARAVLAEFSARPLDPPGRILERAHQSARSTRGAAAAIARIDANTRQVTFAGIGNVAAWTWEGGTPRALITQHGTLGQRVPRIREEVYPFAAGAALVMHSDGLKTRWWSDNWPPLDARSPQTIATLLHRGAVRGSDDATVVVLRGGRQP